MMNGDVKACLLVGLITAVCVACITLGVAVAFPSVGHYAKGMALALTPLSGVAGAVLANWIIERAKR